MHHCQSPGDVATSVAVDAVDAAGMVSAGVQDSISMPDPGDQGGAGAIGIVDHEHPMHPLSPNLSQRMPPRKKQLSMRT
jgi:hypothetical protein